MAAHCLTKYKTLITLHRPHLYSTLQIFHGYYAVHGGSDSTHANFVPASTESLTPFYCQI